MSRKVVGGTLSVVLPGTLAVGLLLSQPSFAEAFSRGDTDGNGNVVITDAIVILNFLFASGADPVCAPAADTNADGNVNISDPIFLLGVLFLGTGSLSPLTQDDVVICKGLDPAAVAGACRSTRTPIRTGTVRVRDPPFAQPGRRGGDPPRATPSPTRSGGRRSSKGRHLPRRHERLPRRLDARIPGTEGSRATSRSSSGAFPGGHLPPLIPAGLPSKTGPSTGNADAGCRLFDRSCFTCHGKGGVGTFLGQSLLTLTALDLDNPDFIRSRIRMSGPNGPESPYQEPQGCQLLGTVMPFWTSDLLSDARSRTSSRSSRGAECEEAGRDVRVR
jgi:mono/diheme cytochrome c family protein